MKYVEVAPKSGWQTMAKTVRETDEEKIRDTKEDIDTLLVFVRPLAYLSVTRVASESSSRLDCSPPSCQHFSLSLIKHLFRIHRAR